MMYASESRDPTIGTHQSALLLADFVLDDPQSWRAASSAPLSEKVWGYPEAFEPTFENKAPVADLEPAPAHADRLAADVRLRLPAADALTSRAAKNGRRRRTSAATWTWTCGCFAAVTGVDADRDELTRIAERAFTLERLMLARAGRGRPMEEALAPHFTAALPRRWHAASTPPASARLLDEYYAARGWDLKNGWPTEAKLRELGLDFAVEEL